MSYELIIIGGGPGGVAAGVYAARKRLKTAVIAKEIGGQSAVSENIQNWIGTVSVSGAELGKSLKKHLLAYADDILTLKEGELVNKLEPKNKNFVVTTNKETYETKSVLITTGSRRRKLAAPGAEKFENKGVTYCASCDGPLFSGMDVAVVGGGNAGFETAAQLLAYAKSVTLFESNGGFKAEKITVQKVLSNPKMKAIIGVEITEIFGDKFVSGLSYRDKKTDQEDRLAVGGIFVEIGAVPATEFAKGIVEMDSFGRIVVNPRNQRAKLAVSPKIVSGARQKISGAQNTDGVAINEIKFHDNADEMISGGIWAAGDCTDGIFHQNNIAVGDAIKALEDIYIWLQKK